MNYTNTIPNEGTYVIDDKVNKVTTDFINIEKATFIRTVTCVDDVHKSVVISVAGKDAVDKIGLISILVVDDGLAILTGDTMCSASVKRVYHIKGDNLVIPDDILNTYDYTNTILSIFKIIHKLGYNDKIDVYRVKINALIHHQNAHCHIVKILAGGADTYGKPFENLLIPTFSHTWTMLTSDNDSIHDSVVESLPTLNAPLLEECIHQVLIKGGPLCFLKVKDGRETITVLNAGYNSDGWTYDNYSMGSSYSVPVTPEDRNIGVILNLLTEHNGITATLVQTIGLGWVIRLCIHGLLKHKCTYNVEPTDENLSFICTLLSTGLKTGTTTTVSLNRTVGGNPVVMTFAVLTCQNAPSVIVLSVIDVSIEDGNTIETYEFNSKGNIVMHVSKDRLVFNDKNSINIQENNITLQADTSYGDATIVNPDKDNFGVVINVNDKDKTDSDIKITSGYDTINMVDNITKSNVNFKV